MQNSMINNNLLSRKDFKICLVVIGIIILVKSFLFYLLYKNGFIAISADEYSRTIKAYYWAQDPRLVFEGLWMPFGYYIEGIVLKFWNNLFLAPRITTLIASIFAVTGVYFLSLVLFDSKKVGLVAVLLSLFHPAVNWYSYLPFVSMYHGATLIWGFIFFHYWLRQKKTKFLFLTAVMLLFCSGFRYESWFFVACFSFYMLFLSFKNLKIDWKRSASFILLSIIPAIFCLIWVVASSLRSGNVLELHHIRGRYFAGLVDKGGEFLSKVVAIPREFLSKEFIVFSILIFVSIGVLFITKKRVKIRPYNLKYIIFHVVLILLVICMICFYVGITGPPGVRTRIIVPYFLILLPLCGWSISLLFENITPNKSIHSLTVISGLIIILLLVTYEIKDIFNYPPSQLFNETHLGFDLKETIEENPLEPEEKVLLQLSYWGYRGVVVGSNNPNMFIFDGPENPLVNHGQNHVVVKKYHRSIFASHPKVIQDFIRKNNIRYAAIRGVVPLKRLAMSTKISLISQQGYWYLLEIEK